MIKMNLSGSDSIKNTLVGSMHFMKSGDVGLTLHDKDDSVSINDKSALLITSEFLMYALGRDDWMLEFLNSMYENLKDVERQSLRDKLRIIDGGLSRNDEDPN